MPSFTTGPAYRSLLTAYLLPLTSYLLPDPHAAGVTVGDADVPPGGTVPCDGVDPLADGGPLGGVVPVPAGAESGCEMVITLLALSHALRGSFWPANRRRTSPSKTCTIWAISSATLASSEVAPTCNSRPSEPLSSAP